MRWHFLNFLLYSAVICGVMFTVEYCRFHELNQVLIPALVHDHSALNSNNVLGCLLHADNSRIFFHETSGTLALNFEQTCCVEAAAFHNPTRKVQVFLSRHLKNKSKGDLTWLKILKTYANIEVTYVTNAEYFKNTPLERWYFNGTWAKSPYKTAHMSDYIRTITLLKSGGLYLDLDTLVLKPLSTQIFWNFTIVENLDQNLVASSFFHLEHGHPIIDELINILALQYKFDIFDHHGRKALTKALKQYCNIPTQALRTDQCKHVKFLPSRMMLALDDEIFEAYSFQPTGQPLLTRAYHSFVFQKFRSLGVGNKQVKTYHENLLKNLAKRNCPKTATMKKQFIYLYHP